MICNVGHQSLIILSCKHVVWSKVRKISDENAAEEVTSNLGTATLDATTVQEDDVGFVTVLPGGENATWFKVFHFFCTMNKISQARYRKQKF